MSLIVRSGRLATAHEVYCWQSGIGLGPATRQPKTWASAETQRWRQEFNNSRLAFELGHHEAEVLKHPTTARLFRQRLSVHTPLLRSLEQWPDEVRLPPRYIQPFTSGLQHPDNLERESA